jgi:putative nucleotidyltransferase with HDIG domain
MKDNALPKISATSDKTMVELARTLMAIMERRDPSLKNHCERVANNCANFCESVLSWPEEAVEAIFIAGVMHDIGLIFLPLDTLQKSEELTEYEKSLVKDHPVNGHDILSNLTCLDGILPTIRHHHETFDGSGYPDGLKGERIPLGARILSLFDSYDSMTSPRNQPSGLSIEEALAEIKNKSAEQFDESFIANFVPFIKSASDESEGWLEKKDRAIIKQIFVEILNNFKAGKIDAPVMPQIIREVEKVIQHATSNVDDVVRVVRNDPVISLRLIAIANSPVYRGVQKIESLKHAIPRIGLKETQNIVIAISLKSLYTAKRLQFQSLMDELWVHVLACAYGSKLIAQHLKIDDPDKYFLMGLIHDIGKALLLKAFTDDLQGDFLNIGVVKSNLQEGHVSLGAGLLKRWGFNDDFISVISHHEDNEFSPDASKELLVIHLANMLTRNIGYSLFDHEVDLVELESAKLLEIDANALENIGEEVKGIIRDLKDTF